MASQHPSPPQSLLGFHQPLLFHIDMQLHHADDDSQQAAHLSSLPSPLPSSPSPQSPDFFLLKTSGMPSGDQVSDFPVLAAPLLASDALGPSQADDLKNSDRVSASSLSPFSHPSDPPSTGRRHTFDSPPLGSRFDPFASRYIPLAPRKRREGMNEDAVMTMHQNSANLAKLRTLELATDEQVKHQRMLHLDAAEKANDKHAKQPRQLYLDEAADSFVEENSATLGAKGSLHPPVSLSRRDILESKTSEALCTEDCSKLLSPNQTMAMEGSLELRTESVHVDDTLCRTPPDKIFMISSSFPPTPTAPRKNFGSLRPSPLRQKRPRRLNFEG